jgi:hypothetical protein
MSLRATAINCTQTAAMALSNAAHLAGLAQGSAYPGAAG